MTATSVHVPTALGNGRGKAKSFKAVIENPAVAKRSLHPHQKKTAKTPFLYDVNALGSLRPDQVPRFLGALTDSEKLADATVPLKDLIAMQDRVDPDKVNAIMANGAGAKKPVIVKHDGKLFIADGHHRLAADWLAGKDVADVKLKDLEPVDTALKSRDPFFRIAKVDESLGVVFGWAVICKVNGEDYYDWNVDHAGSHKGKLVPENVTEDAMLKASVGFMESGGAGNEMHEGADVGKFLFAFPLTTDIAKAMGIECAKSGLMVGYQAPPAVLAKFKSGEYSGFSIEGSRLKYREHD